MTARKVAGLRGEELIRDFFVGFIKIHMLHHGSLRPFCGADMAKELKRHGYEVSPGTLYPALRRLERDGYLKSEKRLDGGRLRIYYRATRKGARALMESKKRIHELVREVLKSRQGSAI